MSWIDTAALMAVAFVLGYSVGLFAADRIGRGNYVPRTTHVDGEPPIPRKR